MPRDGSGIYHRPVGTDAVTDTTIESSKYNINVADVEQDLNQPRPIVAGGTGANNAADALTSLQGDKAYQVVTNYDAHPFVSGSFYSAPGATSAPVAGHAFAGVCYTSDPAVTPPAFPASANLVIEARDQNDTAVPGKLYVREKKAGLWGAWTVMAGSTADMDAAYVNVTGDTMTGNLTINTETASAQVVLDPVTASQQAVVNFGQSGVLKWQFGKQSNDDIILYDTAGASMVLTASSGGSGSLTLGRSTSITGGVTAASATINGPAAIFGNVGVSGSITAGSGINSITVQYSANNYTTTDGTNIYYRSAGAHRFENTAGTLAYAVIDGNGLTVASGNTHAGVGVNTRTGTTGAYGTNQYNLYYNGPVQLWIDATNVGNITTSSDYRIKKDVIDLPGMWDAVKALRPVKYTQAQFSPPSHIEYVAGLRAEKAETVPGHMFEADNIERWGFIAHELQATLIESAANGDKDSPDTIQSPNPFTLIAALTRALQEAMTRIEALEARP